MMLAPKIPGRRPPWGKNPLRNGAHRRGIGEFVAAHVPCHTRYLKRLRLRPHMLRIPCKDPSLKDCRSELVSNAEKVGSLDLPSMLCAEGLSTKARRCGSIKRVGGRNTQKRQCG